MRVILKKKKGDGKQISLETKVENTKSDDEFTKRNTLNKETKIEKVKNVVENKNKKKVVNNAVPDFKLTEIQLNNASYEIAVKQDRREFIKYYWSLIKLKQLFIFTFYTSEDYILRSTKITLFILFVSFYLAFTALFFNDNIMRAIYIYKGNTDAAVHIPNIILSSLCCLVASLIIRFVSLNERDISKIMEIKDQDKRKAESEKIKRFTKIKLIILYAISGALIMFFWYYVSAFCAIFKNSQGHYFINVLVTFILCNLWPLAISLIPAFLRRKALDEKKETMYKISQIIAYF